MISSSRASNKDLGLTLDASDGFGSDVSLDGNRLAVGASEEDTSAGP